MFRFFNFYLVVTSYTVENQVVEFPDRCAFTMLPLQCHLFFVRTGTSRSSVQIVDLTRVIQLNGIFILKSHLCADFQNTMTTSSDFSRREEFGVHTCASLVLDSWVIIN